MVTIQLLHSYGALCEITIATKQLNLLWWSLLPSLFFSWEPPLSRESLWKCNKTIHISEKGSFKLMEGFLQVHFSCGACVMHQWNCRRWGASVWQTRIALHGAVISNPPNLLYLPIPLVLLSYSNLLQPAVNPFSFLTLFWSNSVQRKRDQEIPFPRKCIPPCSWERQDWDLPPSKRRRTAPLVQWLSRQMEMAVGYSGASKREVVDYVLWSKESLKRRRKASGHMCGAKKVLIRGSWRGRWSLGLSCSVKGN